ncbi:hypothetical protein SCLCIDRAFT_623737 [Scleroderma citrinum Foug A]|uniref:Uncharacterized protein n=1 Tax=Scleroderma citrinum Foug A TaxID=1036808 RepID=A0A0C2YPH8_9AGAM|nr:hypothetical protein SCLCIDRAFT_623737 [Scleroderma citrinum Foug A]
MMSTWTVCPRIGRGIYGLDNGLLFLYYRTLSLANIPRSTFHSTHLPNVFRRGTDSGGRRTDHNMPSIQQASGVQSSRS